MLVSLPDDAPGAAALRDELDRARITPSVAVPPDVVTMNSRIRFVVQPGARKVEATLVHPRDFAGRPAQLSVTTPAGGAVLGPAIGQQIAWLSPNGHTVRARILDIAYQPERSADFPL